MPQSFSPMTTRCLERLPGELTKYSSSIEGDTFLQILLAHLNSCILHTWPWLQRPTAMMIQCQHRKRESLELTISADICGSIDII